MSALNDGGQAFPSAVLFDQAIVESKGMSLHDWYAGMAMQAVIGSTNSMTARMVAQASNLYADAMLAVREERTAK